MRAVTVGGGAAAAVAAGMLALPVAMVGVVVAGQADRTAGPSGGVTTCTVAGSEVTVEDLDPEQTENARTLVAVGKELGVPSRGWVVALATALQESGLRNLTYGDRDSLGMMQQRPSMGWGAPEQVTDPSYAARAFYGGPESPTRNSGLLSVAGWQDMPVWEAAQAVQRSAYPLAYAKHEELATSVVRRLTGETPGCAVLAPGPWRLPLEEASYTPTSAYGHRISPTRGTADFHTGQDLAAPVGTPVTAVSRGTVSFAGWGGNYGQLVRVRHAHGVESWYAHLSESTVTSGQVVRAGDRLGLVGSTGNSTGPHLHLEIRVDDTAVDPEPWLSGKGVDM